MIKLPKFLKADEHFNDPFASVVSSGTGLDTFVNGINLIPKFQINSRSALSYLYYVKQVCAESPTHISCLNAINDFAFQGKVQIIKSEISGIENERVVASSIEKQRFLDMSLRMGIDFSRLIDCIKSANTSLSESGDAYIYTRLLYVEGRWVTHFEIIEYNEFMYWGGKDVINPDFNSDIGVWCSDWSQIAMSKGNHKVLKVTRASDKIGNWSKIRNGFETVFHVKNANTSKLYGKFDLYSILKNMMTEISEDKKMLKISSHAMTALSMLFLPIDPRQDDGTQAIEAKRGISESGTNSGKGNEIIVSTYYAEDGKPELINLPVHRDSNWSERIDDRTLSKIHGYHGISAEMTSSRARKASIGSNANLDEFIKLNGFTIEPKQQFWENIVSDIFSRIGELTGEKMLIDYSIVFENRLQKIIDTISEKSTKIGVDAKNVINTTGS